MPKMLNIIVNPKSLKKGAKLLKKIEEYLKERGIEYHLFRSDRPGASTEFARCLTEAGEKEIIVFGGGGTLNEVLTGIKDPANCTIGLIPAGTGNDFAKAAKVPNGVEALDLILNTDPRPTDYIQFSDGKRSMNIAGIGMDVDILERCEKKRSKSRKSKYFFALLSSLAHYQGLTVEVSADDGEVQRYSSLIACVCNGHIFGGGIPICPGAQIDDGKLDLIVIDCPPRWRIPIDLGYLMRGKILKRSISRHVTCTSATITPVAGRSLAQYDGELMECDSLTATIVSGKLKMYRG